MLYTVKDDLNLLQELKLTPKQLIFIKLIYQPTPDERRINRGLIYKFQKVSPLASEELIDLINREIVIDSNEIGNMYYDQYELNSKFLKLFAVKTANFIGQIRDLYPKRFEVAGRLYNGIDCDVADHAKDYLEAIGNDYDEHERVKDDLKWAVENNRINMGLKKFIVGRYWLAFREERNKPGQKPIINARIG
jgi:hypothetical protein